MPRPAARIELAKTGSADVQLVPRNS